MGKSFFRNFQLSVKVYDAINEEAELPNVVYPDSDESKSIIEFHACKLEVSFRDLN